MNDIISLNSNVETVSIGIDIGGTNTLFGLVNPRGDVLFRGKLETGRFTQFSDFVSALKNEVFSASKSIGLSPEFICGIGVGAPCVNCITGVVEGAVDLPWRSPIPLAESLQKAFGVPVKACNDANAAAMGEMCYGACRGIKDFIMLTLGTGVGSTIVADGQLLLGKRGLAGELGHTIIRYDSDRLCSCGRKGCLEMYCSARGVVRTALEILEHSKTESALSEIPREDLTPKLIYEGALCDDPVALETLRFTGEILGEACANFAAFSSPEAFVLFGGVAGAFPLFRDAMIESFNKHLLWVYRDQIKFLQSSLSAGDAAILGAAAAGRLGAARFE